MLPLSQASDLVDKVLLIVEDLYILHESLSIGGEGLNLIFDLGFIPLVFPGSDPNVVLEKHD